MQTTHHIPPADAMIDPQCATPLDPIEVLPTPPGGTTRHGALAAALLMLAALGGIAPVWAAPHVTILMPQDATKHCSPEEPCTQPTLDGWVPPLEYADGKWFPLQDYTNGGPNGKLYLMVTDKNPYAVDECNYGPHTVPSLPYVQDPCRAQTLFIGMRVPRPTNATGDSLDAAGIVTIWLDAKRQETIDNVSGANKPRPEDRRLTLRYDLTPGGTVSLRQMQGNGTGWTTTSPLSSWRVQYSLSQPEADQDAVHMELTITLRPSFPPNGSSEPLTSRTLGLAIQHTPTKAAGGGIFYNNKNAPPQDLLTTSWETLEFKALPSIPLSMAMWNVGQMPDASFTPDGGSGEPDTIAEQIYRREIICLSEVWSMGDRETLIETVNELRQAEGLSPMNMVSDLDDEVFQVGGTTGLMLLSSRAVVESGIHHFQSDDCTGFDCWQQKGVLWARLATPKAYEEKSTLYTTAGDTPIVGTGLDYGEFVDVFCTHVNAGDQFPGEDTDQRRDQFRDIRAYIQRVREGGPLDASSYPYVLGPEDQYPHGTWPSGLDRPAFLLGDLNTSGPRGSAGPGYPNYPDMLADFGLMEPTQFEETNSLFSDRRDLALRVVGPDPADSGTWLGSRCTSTVATELNIKQRIDYVLVFPPADTTELPAYAIKKEPKASVDPHFDPNFVGYDDSSVPPQPYHQCLSDHAEVKVSLSLVKVAESLTYNPAKPHRVTYTIKRVEDRETASGCCADWYSPKIYMYVNNHSKTNEYLTVIENANINPGWYVQTGSADLPDMSANFQGNVYMTGQVYEEDEGPDDHYDTVEETDFFEADNRDAHFTLWTTTGEVWRVAGQVPDPDWFVKREFCGLVQDYPNGMVCETEGNLPSPQQFPGTADNAYVQHAIQVTELD